MVCLEHFLEEMIMSFELWIQVGSHSVNSTLNTLEGPILVKHHSPRKLINILENHRKARSLENKSQVS